MGWGVFTQRPIYYLQNALDISKNLVVPETQHAITPRLNPRCSLGIFCLPFIMLAAIYFDDQRCRRTEEIDDIRADRLLPAESKAADLFLTQTRP